VAQVDDYEGVPAALAALGVFPDASYEASDIMATHRAVEGADYYFVTNQKVLYDTGTRWMNSQGVSQDITFQGEGVPYELDLWTGEITPLARYAANADGSVTVPVTLAANDTRAFAIAPAGWFGGAAVGAAHAASGGAEYLYGAGGELTLRATKAGTYPTLLSSGAEAATAVGAVPKAQTLEDWHLKFINYKPVQDATTYWGVEKVVEYDKDIGAVQSFNTLADYEGAATKSGVGVYTTTVQWDASAASGATLSLGEVHDLYRLTVNDVEVPGANPLDTAFDIGPYLKDGANEIRVEVASNIYDAVVGVRGYSVPTPSGFGGGTQQQLPDALTVTEFGLVTLVTLTPYRDVVIG
jgi:hypothetical protein